MSYDQPLVAWRSCERLHKQVIYAYAVVWTCCSAADNHAARTTDTRCGTAPTVHATNTWMAGAWCCRRTFQTLLGKSDPAPRDECCAQVSVTSRYLPQQCITTLFAESRRKQWKTYDRQDTNILNDIAGSSISSSYCRPTFVYSCCIHPLEQPTSWYYVIFLLNRLLQQSKDISVSTIHFQTSCFNYSYIDYASTVDTCYFSDVKILIWMIDWLYFKK